LEAKFWNDKSGKKQLKDEEQPLIEMQSTAVQLQKRGEKIQEKGKAVLKWIDSKIDDMHGLADKGLTEL